MTSVRHPLHQTRTSTLGGPAFARVRCDGETMSDAVILGLVPLVLALFLVWLRGQQPVLWWLTLLGYAVMVGMFLIFRATDVREAIGGSLLYLLPVVAMFVGLRPALFLRNRWLIPPVGIVLYLAGLMVSLSMNVSMGLLQP